MSSTNSYQYMNSRSDHRLCYYARSGYATMRTAAMLLRAQRLCYYAYSGYATTRTAATLLPGSRRAWSSTARRAAPYAPPPAHTLRQYRASPILPIGR
eukprot:1696259-Rhodomonas_salina.1